MPRWWLLQCRLLGCHLATIWLHSFFFSFFSSQKSSNRMCLVVFLRFFETIGANNIKQHCKYQCFWRLASQNPRYVRCFLPLRANITVFTVFCGLCLATTLVLMQLSMQELQNKTVNYSVLDVGAHQQKRQTSIKKCPKYTFEQQAPTRWVHCWRISPNKIYPLVVKHGNFSHPL